MGKFRLPLVVLAAVPVALLRGQLPQTVPAFQNLTPKYDGSAVTFSTRLRLKGEADAGQYPHEKIFVWEKGRGLRLFAQQQPSFNLRSYEWFPATDYRLLAALTSADSATTAYRTLDDCNFGTPCRSSITRYRTRLHRAGQPEAVFEGAGSLSPSGRYLALGPSNIWLTSAAKLLDLETGSITGIPVPIFTQIPHRHFVANNGMAATAVDLTSLQRNPRNLRIDASGRQLFFAYTTQTSASTRVAVFDSGQRRVTELGTASDYDISDDGSMVLLSATDGLWAVRSDGSSRSLVYRQADGELFAELALSGDGSTAFVLTRQSRLMRLDLRTLTAEELIAATPIPDAEIYGDITLARGGVYSFTASRAIAVTAVRFQNDSFILLPGSLDTPTKTVVLQVPFDAPVGDATPEFLLAGGNPASPFQIALASSSPARLSAASPYSLSPALHQDFRGPVTQADPAAPGEVIHVYAKGLGPTTNPPERGQPASADPLSVLIEPLDCKIVDQAGREWRADVLWAGLAPGWFGLYQAEIRLPAEGLAPGRISVCQVMVPVAPAR